MEQKACCIAVYSLEKRIFRLLKIWRGNKERCILRGDFFPLVAH